MIEMERRVVEKSDIVNIVTLKIVEKKRINLSVIYVIVVELLRSFHFVFSFESFGCIIKIFENHD